MERDFPQYKMAYRRPVDEQFGNQVEGFHEILETNGALGDEFEVTLSKVRVFLKAFVRNRFHEWTSSMT